MPDSTDRHHHQVTQLLELAGQGDRHAAAELLPLVYEELRRLARSRLANEPGGGAGHTLQPTALVHEAYLRLVGTDAAGESPSQWNSRGHFFGAAALAMRRILVDRARARAAEKRGGHADGTPAKRVDLDDNAVALTEQGSHSHLLALDEALTALEKYDKDKFQVVMLRYFAGLTIDETAAARAMSPMSVKRDWAFARAWLRREIAGDDARGPDTREAGST